MPRDLEREHGAAQRVDDCKIPCKTHSFPPGSAGATPKEISEPPKTAVPGSDGKVSIGKAEWSDLAAFVSPTFTGIVLRAAERDYINGAFSQCAERLNWLYGVLHASLNKVSSKHSEGTRDHFAAQQDKVVTLIGQMQSGLDYYGQYYNYVPLLSVQYYTDVVSKLIEHAEAIEQSCLIYKNVKADTDARIKEFKATKDRVLGSLEVIKTRQKDLAADRDKLAAEIANLLSDLSAQWNRLFESEASFKKAIVSNGPGCGFGEIVKFGASISTLYGSGDAVWGAISTAIGAFKTGQLSEGGKPIRSNFGKLKYRVDRVADAGTSIKSFVSAYNDVKDVIAPDGDDEGIPALPSDEAKIVASFEDIDREVNKFASLPEATAYRETLRQFVSCAVTRNNKILQYQSTDDQWRKLDAEARQAQLDAKAVSTSIALTSNPFIDEAVAFMDRASLDAKISLVQVIHQLHRSFRYYSLRNEQFQIADFSVAALRSTARELLNQYVRQRERVGTDPQRFYNKIVDLKPHLPDAELDRFRQQGKVTVSVPITDPTFGSRCHVRASKIWISLQGDAAIPKRLNATITHHGQSMMKDENGLVHDFLHVGIKIAYETNDDGSIAIDPTIRKEHGDYEGISPFGLWSVELHELDPKVLSSVSSVRLHFDGWARA
jgi:hypothetical protein